MSPTVAIASVITPPRRCLQRPERDELGQVRRDAAKRRADQERRDRGAQQAPAAELVAELAHSGVVAAAAST